MARTITPFLLQTRFEVDPKQGRAAFRTINKDVDQLGARFSKLGKDVDRSMRGVDAGRRFGRDFSSSAVSVIEGSIKSFGQTIGSLVGTAVAPGIGTAVGSTIGSALDKALEKLTGPILETIQRGIELNKELEQTRIEFTTFTGSEREAVAYLERLKQLSTDTGLRMGVLVEASERVYDFSGSMDLANKVVRAAIEQSAEFGGGVTNFMKVADALGLIAEKGELSGRELTKLYRLGIDAPKRLAEATGMSVDQIKRLMRQGRIEGAVASRLISESIIREKGGFAQRLAMTSTRGAEQRFEALTEIRAMEGTQRATKGLGDFYRAANEVLSSEGAQKFVSFIDDKTGSLIQMVEKASRTGISVAGGLADGIVSGDALKSLGSSFTKIGDYTESTLKSVFEIRSPSERSRREVGVPIGEGIAQGISDGFVASFKGQTTEEIVSALRELTQDPRVRQFFEAIRRAEGGSPDVMAGGRRVSSGRLHPGEVVPRSQWFRGDRGPSSAAGNYQITRTNWRKLSKQLGLDNFSDPEQQLLAAVKLFADRESGAGLRALLSGDLDTAMRIAAKDWTSTPESKIGGGRQLSRQRWLSHYAEAGAVVSGQPVTEASPLPVKVMPSSGRAVLEATGNYSPALLDWLYGMENQGTRRATRFGSAREDRDDAGYSVSVDFDPSSIATAGLNPTVLPSGALLPSVDSVIKLYDTLETLPGFTDKILTFEQSMKLAAGTLGEFGVGLPPLTAEMMDFGREARAEFALTNEALRANRAELIRGIQLREQLSGMIASIAGFLPQQQVGRKRGFFSKLLGIAAPFLAFIPGVGPLLSQVASIASSAVGGNWAGVATGIAGGLQPGGVFNPSGGGGGGPTSTSHPGEGLEPRAAGGTVRRGRRYWVGEHGPEPFVPFSDGYVFPHGTQFQSSPGAFDPAPLISTLDRLHATLARLEAMSPQQVVRMGARGMIEAMDQDYELVRLHGRRMRGALA